MGTHISLNEGSHPFLRGDNYEKTKIQWRTWNIYLRTTGPILTKLGTKHPRVIGTHVSSNEGPRTFPISFIITKMTTFCEALEMFQFQIQKQVNIFYQVKKMFWRLTMSFEVKAEQQSCIVVFVLLKVWTLFRLEFNLLKQMECVRTVSRNLLYRWHKYFIVKHLIQSEMKETEW